MWTMLAGVPGKLKTLLDRLTASRAANLDKLDANISTRAAASTALSTAVWTNTRAGRLDASVLVNGVVKSVASYIIDSPNTSGSGEDNKYRDITIASVNTARSVIIVNGDAFGEINDGSGKLYPFRLRLINSTTVRISADYVGSSGFSTKTRFTVLEFF